MKAKGMATNETEIDYGAKIAKIKSDEWRINRFLKELKNQRFSENPKNGAWGFKTPATVDPVLPDLKWP